MAEMISDSEFNMWRAVTAMIHADRRVVDKEVDVIMQKLDHQNMSDAQRAQITDELDNPVQIGEILPLITEPQDRATLVHYARLMAWSDGVLEADEEIFVELLRKNAVDKIQLEDMKNVARAHAMTETAKIMEELKTVEAEEERELSFAFRWLYRLID